MDGRVANAGSDHLHRCGRLLPSLRIYVTWNLAVEESGIDEVGDPILQKPEDDINDGTVALFVALIGQEPTGIQRSMMFHGDDAEFDA